MWVFLSDVMFDQEKTPDGKRVPNEGDVSVIFDDSIIQDTTSEKQQDMAEVAAGLLTRDELRERWYGDAALRGGSKGGLILLERWGVITFPSWLTEL